ncbi:MAG TPA: hypothetical protein VIZ90_01325 [Rhizobiaceae bacterium]
MMLGDVLAAASRSGVGMDEWLQPADPLLWSALNAAAEGENIDPSEFARASIAEFSERATEEDWAMLMSRMREDDDPGRACLLTMMRWRLRGSLNGVPQPITGSLT